MGILRVVLIIVLLMAFALTLKLAGAFNPPSAPSVQSPSTTISPPAPIPLTQVPNKSLPEAPPSAPLPQQGLPKVVPGSLYKIAFITKDSEDIYKENADDSYEWQKVQTIVGYKDTYYIYTMNADGGNHILIGSTTAEYNNKIYDSRNYKISQMRGLEIRPSWSPDGTKIAALNAVFSVDGKSKWQINPTTCVKYWAYGLECAAVSRSISWSPDSRMIAFNGNFDDHTAIYTSEVAGGNVRRLTDYFSYNGDPAWSPDGSKIAFLSGRLNSTDMVDDSDWCAVFLMNAEGGFQNKLTDTDWGLVKSALMWSPDNTKIAYKTYSKLYVIDVINRNPLAIATDGGFDNDLTWSPDSRRIAYSKDEAKPGTFYIYAINADGSNRRQLASGSNPDWSPDGKLIVYNRADGVYIMNEDGSNQKKLTDFGSTPVWSPK